MRNFKSLCLLAVVAVLSSCEAKLNFSSFEQSSSSFEFKDVPGSVNMEVGQSKAVVIGATTSLKYSIKATSMNPDVVEVSNVNDSTVLFKAKRIGTVMVTVNFSIWSQDIQVNVGELTLTDFKMDASEAVLSPGESLFRAVDLDPVDYSVHKLDVEVVSTVANIVTATPYVDTLSSTQGILFMGIAPGQAKVYVRGTKKDGSKIEYCVNVKVSASAVKAVYLRQYAGTQTVQGIEQAKYVRLDDGLSYKRSGDVQMGVIWDPENAFVSDAGLVISGVSEDLKTKDDGGNYTEGQIADLLNSEEVDMAGFEKKFSCKLLSAEEALKTAVMTRDTTSAAKDMFSYNLSSTKPCVVILRAFVRYQEYEKEQEMERYIVVRFYDSSSGGGEDF